MISTLTTPSNNGVRGLGSDTAVVISVPCHLDVSTGSPSCSPRVLHQVVVAASLRSVSDSKDGVGQSSGEASMATDTGPTRARALVKSFSLPGWVSWKLLTVATTFPRLNLQYPCRAV